jgi:hypothetical protein
MSDLNSRTADLVDRFAAALKEKLAAAEKKYGHSDGWASREWMNECRQHLREHIQKGDPRDVAAYCAFLWHHGESTADGAALPVPAKPKASEEASRAVLADVHPVTIHAWKIQGRTVGAMLSEARNAIEELTEELVDAKDAARDHSGETEAQRLELVAAWNDLPDALRSHPGLKRLYRALGGINRDGVKGDVNG